MTPVLHMTRDAVLWGFSATVVLTTILSASRGLGFTRMDVSFMIGTIFTSNRDKARWLGFLVHMLNGWMFAFVYIMAFSSSRLWHWWFGVLVGLVHSLFVLTVIMSIMPSIHPRMATETQGPDPTRLLEPPGFLASNYGRGTPIATVAAHLVFGAILGMFAG